MWLSKQGLCRGQTRAATVETTTTDRRASTYPAMSQKAQDPGPVQTQQHAETETLFTPSTKHPDTEWTVWSTPPSAVRIVQTCWSEQQTQESQLLRSPSKSKGPEPFFPQQCPHFGTLAPGATGDSRERKKPPGKTLSNHDATFQPTHKTIGAKTPHHSFTLGVLSC